MRAMLMHNVDVHDQVTLVELLPAAQSSVSDADTMCPNIGIGHTGYWARCQLLKAAILRCRRVVLDAAVALKPTAFRKLDTGLFGRGPYRCALSLCSLRYKITLTAYSTTAHAHKHGRGGYAVSVKCANVQIARQHTLIDC